MHAGFDTYGQVKTVGKTPVVTNFFMVIGLPVVPLQSYYYSGPGESKTEGVPFIFMMQKKTFHGIPLARIDFLSVTMAYIRGLCGALLVIGSMGMIMLILNLNANRPLDGFQIAIISCFFVGSLGGILTYLLPFQVTQRGRAIRLLCGEILGICADLALVREDHAIKFAAVPMQANSSNPRSPLAQRHDLLGQLIQVRAKIAIGFPRESLEQQTDELIEQIQNMTFIESYH